MINADLTVVVFGKHYLSSLDIIRSLGIAGYRVSLALVTNAKSIFNIAAKSKFVSEKKQIPLKEDETVINEFLTFSHSIIGRKFLFPVDDYANAIIDKFREILEKEYILPINEDANHSLTELMDKHVQWELAKKAGLNVPAETVIDLSKPIDIPDNIEYPCFCKPLLSVSGYKKEQCRCNSEEELKEHLNKLKNTNSKRSVLIQKFLEIEDEFVLLGICTFDKAFISGVVNKIIYTKHVKGLGVVFTINDIMDNDELTKIKDKIECFLLSTGYVGMFDLEFAKANGKLFFNELNIRPSGLGYSLVKSKMNLPPILVQSLTNEVPNYSKIQNGKYGITFLSEKNVFDDYFKNTISFRQLCSYYRKTDDSLIKDSKDLVPLMYFYLYQTKRLFSKLAHRRRV
ncbi:ATP-grasp domain-containing protein [Ruminococcus albus]|uniref:ATP-grasp domain-containing protein n=1 Tax=Ruminococcus albus TaxID=1264 RepID=A0A1H7KPS8_RUMAL|nr:ATP-grasp domain-containing protein [Ruminococcus albus]SEK88831.1 ATP-grasp domain-containing protein [Ruminococcus albus]